MSEDLTKYPYLSVEDLEKFRAIELTEEQLQRANEKEAISVKTKLERFSLKIHVCAKPPAELRLVLLGKPGTGKSAVGNLFLGGKHFDESASSKSCTQTIEEGEAEVEGIHVRIIDTPGFHDTDPNKDPKDTQTEIVKVLDTFHDGIHGFLIVINMANSCFTPEHVEFFRQLKEGMFGAGFLPHCFIILSHGEELAKNGSLTEYLETERSGTFGVLVNEMIARRVIAVESAATSAHFRQEQQKQVIRFIASVKSGMYVNREIEQQRWDTQLKLDESVSAFTPWIENELTLIFTKSTRGEIKHLTEEDKKEIIRQTLQKLKKRLGKNVPDKELEKGVASVLGDKQKRLSDESFLQKHKGIIKVLTGMAGVITGVAVILSKVLH